MPKATYYIDSYPTSNSPYYWVIVQDNPNIGPGGMVKINVITGEVLIKGT